ncbi:MAG: 50S ribosomal protein L29 [Clostridia bacterium]|nr:50S ribosomal protein L29 [Clostridia bacterium]
MKAKELVTLNRDELESKVRDLKEELFNLRFQLATGQLQNTMVIQGVRRDIARCMTVLRQQEQKEAQ